MIDPTPYALEFYQDYCDEHVKGDEDPDYLIAQIMVAWANGPGVIRPLPEVRRLLLRESLKAAKGNKKEAAVLMGVSTRTFFNMLKRARQGKNP